MDDDRNIADGLSRIRRMAVKASMIYDETDMSKSQLDEVAQYVYNIEKEAKDVGLELRGRDFDAYNEPRCCRNCPNNPRNNPHATGFCHCILPSLEQQSYSVPEGIVTYTWTSTTTNTTL